MCLAGLAVFVGCADQPQGAIDKQMGQAIQQASDLLTKHAHSHAVWQYLLEDIELTEDQLGQLASTEGKLSPSASLRGQAEIKQITAQQAKLLDDAIELLKNATSASAGSGAGEVTGKDHAGGNALFGAVLGYRALWYGQQADRYNGQVVRLGYDLHNRADNLGAMQEQLDQLAGLDFQAELAQVQVVISKLESQLRKEEQIVEQLEALAKDLQQQQRELSKQLLELNRQIKKMYSQADKATASGALKIYKAAAQMQKRRWKLEQQIESLAGGPYQLADKWAITGLDAVGGTERQIMGLRQVNRVLELAKIRGAGVETALKGGQDSLKALENRRKLIAQRIDSRQKMLGPLGQVVSDRLGAVMQTAQQAEKFERLALADLSLAGKHLGWALRAHSSGISAARSAKSSLKPGQEDKYIDQLLAGRDLAVGVENLSAEIKVSEASVQTRRARRLALGKGRLMKVEPLVGAAAGQPTVSAQQREEELTEVRDAATKAIMQAAEAYEKLFKDVRGEQKVLVAAHLGACYILAAQIRPELRDQYLAQASETLTAGLENQPADSRLARSARQMQNLLTGG